MPYIDFNVKPKVKIWEGINAALHHSNQATFAHVVLDANIQVPEHSHVHEQWTHVIEGSLEFNLAGEIKILTSGMAAFMPSNILHSAMALTSCKVIDCFLPVREDFVALENAPS